ncbi:MAG: energy-coupled thiamine transporter ThiT [Lachnospiraceae bacterium]|nr:energy-coupled thiamine transporter ThiT [Lachnospiraceae bacterium]
MFLDVFKEDGYAALTPAGYIACAVIILLIVVLSILFVKPKENAKPHWKSKQLVFSAACLALAFLLSYIQPYKMPWGGSVTLFSMLFICLVGNWYGLRAGLTVAFTYSILQFIQSGGSYILTPLQVCCDYFFAFTALGFSGVFAGKKNGLIKGYILGIFLRGVFHSIGGYLYWMDYMPDNFPKALSAIYPIVYNYSYILIEGVATVLILCIPAVKSALNRIKRMTTE